MPVLIWWNAFETAPKKDPRPSGVLLLRGPESPLLAGSWGPSMYLKVGFQAR